MKITLETKQTAQDALDYLREHPERHDQNVWFNNPNTGEIRLFDPSVLNVCDTTMCVAGTVMWQKMGLIKTYMVDDFASKELGLNERESNWLFYETTNQQAIDALTAIANGDEDKFNALRTADWPMYEPVLD